MSKDKTKKKKNKKGKGLIVATASSDFMPAHLDAIKSVAKMLSINTLIPAVFHDNFGNCAMIAYQAARWKMDPFQLAQEAYIVSNKLGFSGKTIAGVIDANANLKGRLRYRYKGEGQDMQCEAYATFVGEDEPQVYESPMIKRIKVKNSPLWVSDPKLQLLYFSARNWARAYAPGIMLGIMEKEEVETSEDFLNPTYEAESRIAKARTKRLEAEAINTEDETIEDAVIVEEEDDHPEKSQTETQDDVVEEDGNGNDDVDGNDASEPASEATDEDSEDDTREAALSYNKAASRTVEQIPEGDSPLVSEGDADPSGDDAITQEEPDGEASNITDDMHDWIEYCNSPIFTAAEFEAEWKETKKQTWYKALDQDQMEIIIERNAEVRKELNGE